MLHDELFVSDLERVGVSREQLLATEPYLSTKLLSGYFSYLLDHEGPLGVVAYSYLVEYVNVKLEPKKLEALKESVGGGNIGGQINHSHTDINDDHPGEVGGRPAPAAQRGRRPGDRRARTAPRATSKTTSTIFRPRARRRCAASPSGRATGTRWRWPMPVSGCRTWTRSRSWNCATS